MNHVGRRSKRRNLREEDVVQLAQAIKVLINDGHVRAHAYGNLRGVCADHTAAKYDHASGWHARHAAQKNSSTARHLLKVMSADLHGHAPRHFRHRSEQRKRAASIRNGLVSDARDFSFEQLSCQLRLRRKMKISEEQLAFAHARVFGRNRLFHFHNHLAFGPNVVGRIKHGRARALVERVFKTRAFARASFDNDPMPRVRQSAHTSRSQTNSVLVILNLFRKSNNHSLAPHVWC